MTISAKPEILFIDAYDSFSNTLAGLIEQTLNANVHVIRIDGEKDLSEITQHFDAVVVGPGPGNPARPQDVGISQQLWTLSEADLLPVLGICLGCQSMGLAFGARINTLTQARHGIVCNVIHEANDIFEGVGPLQATQYHSLHVVLDDTSMTRPLAYTDDETNGKVCMALKIRQRPFWGLQFHPESICTSQNARRLITNWWNLSQAWLKHNQRTKRPPYAALCRNHSTKPSITDSIRAPCPSLFPPQPASINWTVISSAGLDIADIYERLNMAGDKVILLDSQGHSSGRFSILGIIPSSESIELLYSGGNLSLVTNGQESTTELSIKSQKEVWQIIREIMAANAVDAGPADVPFWGGFIGYISYEAGLESLDIDISGNRPSYPDISFSWISRSVVFDHAADQIYIQHLGLDRKNWIDEMVDRITTLEQISPHRTNVIDRGLHDVIIEKAVPEKYCNKVELCKKLLAVGESYELCLTHQTKIYLPSGTDDNAQEWSLYKRLRAANPAPFGAFLQTSHLTILGSSPERFLSWTRSGRCQFRPIKGTVKKQPGVDSEKATKILCSSKERAENLMIVDLIRHDLSGIVGLENCWVPKLMQIEEYETVFQLVSVIEGQISEAQHCSSRRPLGIDILKASLPPGSMTGAPKKRSCEILKRLENEPRGVYSGVLGYLDVGGGGDFSVVIRTAIKQKDEIIHKTKSTPHHVWRIGAGGAVTIQSDAVAEFEEMETKLDSVLRVFR